MAPLFWWVAVAGVARGLALITGKSPYRDKFPSGADRSLSAVGVMVADHVRRVPPVAGSAMYRRPAWACRAQLDTASRGDSQHVAGQRFVDDQVDRSGEPHVRRVAESLRVGLGDVHDACLQAGGVVGLQWKTVVRIVPTTRSRASM